MIAVDAACDAHGDGHVFHQLGVELSRVACVAVAEQIYAVHALGGVALRFGDDVGDVAAEDGGAFGKLAHKGHICQAVGLAKLVDGWIEFCTHQNIAAAF